LLGEVPTIYEGEGTMLKRVIWDYTSFKTNFGFVNHYVIPPGVSVPYHRHPDMEEIYYILSGIGRMTIDDVTIDVRAGDCGSVTLNGAHGIYNNSNEDIHMLAIGCSVNEGVFTGIRLHDNLKNK
ncbi:cupin domain-containing protein, partial [Candidatus Latescibacterota bacterium]